MAPKKCCVGGCKSTSDTEKLFSMPRNEGLRNLWMSFIVPASPHLLGLTKDQLLCKRVCQKHFDSTQFDQEGKRLSRSYPCLFSEKEIYHGVPLSSEEYNVLNEHNYCHDEEPDENIVSQSQDEYVVMTGNIMEEHIYSMSSTDVSSNSKSSALKTSRQPLRDLSLTDNGNAKLYETPQPSTSKALKTSRQPLTDSSLNVYGDSILYETPQPSTSKGSLAGRKIYKADPKNYTPKQVTSRGTLGVKQFKAGTRRFIKETTNIAVESLGQTNKQRLQNALTIASRQDLMQNFDHLNKKAKAFLIMQLRLARKNKLGRRFDMNDKLFALALMKQSPKGYKLLQNIFALPTKRTLARLSTRIVFDCGINDSTFHHISNTIKNWDDKKKLCSLVFDEVALTPNLIYNENKDTINGFVEIAGERRKKFADHALVFMVRGICSSWRQSIAYYFCAGTVAALELAKILNEIIAKLANAGLKPLALVCDQGSTFRSCLKNLKSKSTHESQNDDTINISGHDLFIFHDPPHLLKGIRNNFLNKDIIFEGKRASWGDILYIYDLDIKAGHTRALPKITAEHVDPKKIKKMKVKLAAQVLSARTAAMLNYTHAVHKRLNTTKETMESTAAVVLFFDELFDSVNGSSGQGKGKLRCAVKPNSIHQQFWRDAIKKIKSMTFVDTESKIAKRTGQPRHVRVPCLEGWITTIYSFLGLSKVLFSRYNVEYFYPRFINQDPLENFFGRIRAMNYRNINPDANVFIHTFKSLVLANLLSPQSKFTNCEEDEGETIIDLNYLFQSQIGKENIAPIENVNASSSSQFPISQHFTMDRELVIAEKINVQTSAYTAGYMCRKMTKKFKCHSCTKTYITKEIQGIHDYILRREYKRLKNNNLAYPNGKILRLYRECAQIIHKYLDEHCEKKNVKKNILVILDQCDMSWLGCRSGSHRQKLVKYFKTLVIRLQVHNWVNTINKILRGKIDEKHISQNLKMHIAAMQKFKIYRLRKKAINK